MSVSASLENGTKGSAAYRVVGIHSLRWHIGPLLVRHDCELAVLGSIMRLWGIESESEIKRG